MRADGVSEPGGVGKILEDGFLEGWISDRLLDAKSPENLKEVLMDFFPRLIQI